MTEKEFTVYDGKEYKKIIGKYDGDDTGHYKVNIKNNQIITVLGTWLDQTANMEWFKSSFYETLDLSTWTGILLPYNYILIGKDIIYSFNQFIINTGTGAPDRSKEQLFDILIDIIRDLGYVNSAPEFIYDINIKCKKIKIVLTDKITGNLFDIYFVPLDYIGIKLGGT